MEFTNAVRNKFNKCDSPDSTLKRIKAGFASLGYNPTYAPVHVSEHLYWGRIWIDPLRVVCEGKGVSAQLAEASAHAELAERVSAGLYYPVFEEQVRFHLPALYSQKTNDFLNYAWMPGYIQARQEELDNPLTVETLLKKQTQLQQKNIDAIKDCEMARHWVDGYSLLSGKKVKVPVKFAAYIHGTNGVAAGNTVEEALLQAGCEVLERYIQIHVIKTEPSVPTIDRASIDNPQIRAMIDFYRNANVGVTVKDLTFGGRFPVIGVLYTNRNLPPDRMEYRTLIAGASFNLEEALTRCFTEGIQGKETLTASRKHFDRSVIPKERIRDYYSVMKCGVSPKDISFLSGGDRVSFKNFNKTDMLSELEGLKQLVSELETDCILLDHTHPVINFPVVRVIIPGISDFLEFLPPDILVDEKTSPATAWRGEDYDKIMRSFFH